MAEQGEDQRAQQSNDCEKADTDMSEKKQNKIIIKLEKERRYMQFTILEFENKAQLEQCFRKYLGSS